MKRRIFSGLSAGSGLATQRRRWWHVIPPGSWLLLVVALFATFWLGLSVFSGEATLVLLSRFGASLAYSATLVDSPLLFWLYVAADLLVVGLAWGFFVLGLPGRRLVLPVLGTLVGIAYGYGVVLGCIGLLWHGLQGRGLPQLTWWGYALAPLGLGAAAMAAEFVAAFLANGFTVDGHAPRARKALGATLLVVLVLVLVIGLPWYNISQQ